MRITLLDGSVRSIPFSAHGCMGYVAKMIEIDSRDVRLMSMMAKKNPTEFHKIMAQLEHRFPDRRLPCR